MSNDNGNRRRDTTARAGMSFPAALGLLFIALKLTGFIDWSWWLVTLPLWFPLAFAAGLMGVGMLMYAVSGVLGVIDRALGARR